MHAVKKKTFVVTHHAKLLTDKSYVDKIAENLVTSQQHETAFRSLNPTYGGTHSFAVGFLQRISRDLAIALDWYFC